MTTIARIPVPTAAEFRSRYVATRTPVVIEGLFAGHELGRMGTQERARERMGQVPVSMVRNYMDKNVQNIADIVAGRPFELVPEVRQGTLDDYFDLAGREPGERWMLTENIPAASLFDGVDLSPLGIDRVEPGYGAADDGYEAGKSNSMMFVGGPGNASDLHTDWDGRQVVLYQVFGHKRAVLFPSEAAESMQAIDIFAMLRLRGLGDARRAALVQSLGGCEVELHAGDALFMPAFCWHHLDYIDTSMAVSFRFDTPADPGLRFLINHLHRDGITQNLYVALLDPAVLARHAGTVEVLRQAYERPYPDAVAKYHAMRTAALAAYEEVCLDGKKHTPATWIACSDFLDKVLSYRYSQ